MLTKTQYAVLKRAARRDSGSICPTPGLWAAAQESVISALIRKGLARRDGRVPVITTAGKVAVLRYVRTGVL